MTGQLSFDAAGIAGTGMAGLAGAGGVGSGVGGVGVDSKGGGDSAAAGDARYIALWFPNWPLVAARRAGAPADVVVAKGAVLAAGSEAKAAGITQGMRLRHARLLMPMLVDAATDAELETRLFEEVLLALDQVAAGIEVIRPGLVVIAVAPLVKFYGSEEDAADRLINVAASLGIETQVGLADDLNTAIIAARRGAKVTHDLTRDFLRDIPLRWLAREPALDIDPHVVEVLTAVGVTRCGQLAAMQLKDIASRCGTPGEWLWRLAIGETRRATSSSEVPDDLRVTHVCEPPLQRVDEAAFLGRALAAELHSKVRARGQAMSRVKVVAEIYQDGELTELSRVWRARQPLTESATAERLRWQCDSWLSTVRTRGSGGAGGGAGPDESGKPRGGRPLGRRKPVVPAPSQEYEVDEAAGEDFGIVRISLIPVDLEIPEAVGLFDQANARDEEIERLVARLQSSYGPEKIRRLLPRGTRGVADRIDSIAFGDEAESGTGDNTPWEGAIPAPFPAQAGGFRPLHLTATAPTGEQVPCYVTEEGALNQRPSRLTVDNRSFNIEAWSGPWLVEERWWTDEPLRCARMQLQFTDDAGCSHVLLAYWSERRWQVEAEYG